jgi:hypothetical protein
MVCASVYSAVGNKFQNRSDKYFVRKLRKLPDVTYYRITERLQGKFYRKGGRRSFQKIHYKLLHIQI